MTTNEAANMKLDTVVRNDKGELGVVTGKTRYKFHVQWENGKQQWWSNWEASTIDQVLQ